MSSCRATNAKALREARLSGSPFAKNVALEIVSSVRFNNAGRRLALRLGRLVHKDEIRPGVCLAAGGNVYAFHAEPLS